LDSYHNSDSADEQHAIKMKEGGNKQAECGLLQSEDDLSCRRAASKAPIIFKYEVGEAAAPLPPGPIHNDRCSRPFFLPASYSRRYLLIRASLRPMASVKVARNVSSSLKVLFRGSNCVVRAE